MRNWVDLQDTTDGIYCIVDLHALSVQREPGEVRRATIDLARFMLAIGIDPERSILFVQSRIREHNELAWLMQCSAAFGELRRMTQFKEKSESNEFVSAALFTYPALQAADIALYDTDIVPVGDDQRQHVEFSRDVIQRFNSRYGTDDNPVLVVPEHRISNVAARIMDLQHPESKMSKSLDSPQGTVLLTDTEAEIAKKFKRAVTDNDADVRYDPITKPGVSNLLSILAAANRTDPNDEAQNYTQYGPLKTDTAEAIIELLRPIRKRYEELDDDAVAELLAVGENKARNKATEVMDRVRSAVDLF